ncbi:MAG: hypothetical protein ACI4S2_18020 [Lachnospiraceae bacterium]
MYGNYTQAAKDRCFNVLDQDIYTIWDAIESLSEDETSQCWKEKCEKIAYEYSFSSRFALMRILYSREQGCGLNEAETKNSFVLSSDEKEYLFSELSIEHAENLDDIELKQYECILNDIAKTQPEADVKPELYEYLIAKALRDVERTAELAKFSLTEETTSKERTKVIKESKTLLSREEALKLGHMLGFTINEMEWFLLRVFDFEDGFSYNSSSDLIEAYVFLSKGSWQKAEVIKEKYTELTKEIDKLDVSNRVIDWTQTAGSSLIEKVGKWSLRPDEQEEKFIDWLIYQAPCLDLPSRTASHIYQKLAVYIYEMSVGIIPVPDRNTFIQQLNEICSKNSVYREKAEKCLADKKRCNNLSAELLTKNKDMYTSAPDRAKAWRTVSSDENGLPRLIMAGRPDASRNRVQELLMGNMQVEKGDVLHLLWYGFNLCWEQEPIKNDMADLQSNFADFTETVSLVLDKALLPGFYPPHIMEQSMMLSIIASVEDLGIPAYTYAALCESLIKKRKIH